MIVLLFSLSVVTTRFD